MVDPNKRMEKTLVPLNSLALLKTCWAGNPVKVIRKKTKQNINDTTLRSKKIRLDTSVDLMEY